MGQVDKITFKRFERLAKEKPELCELIPFVTVWDEEKPDGGDPWFKNLIAEVLLRVSLPHQADHPVQATRRFCPKTKRQKVWS